MNGMAHVIKDNANAGLVSAVQTLDASVNERLNRWPMVLPNIGSSCIYHCMKINPQCALIGCSDTATNKHHIGGAGSPMIWVCRACHGRIHGMEWHSGHSDLVKAGIAKARAQGRRGGNPKLMDGDPDFIAAMIAARKERHLRQILNGMSEWLPLVHELRPRTNWKDVARYVSERSGEEWTPERLRRTIMLLVSEGHVDKAVLDRAPQPARATPDKDHLITVITALVRSRTLAAVATELERMGLRTPRGGTQWHASSVAHLLKGIDVPHDRPKHTRIAAAAAARWAKR